VDRLGGIAANASKSGLLTCLPEAIVITSKEICLLISICDLVSGFKSHKSMLLRKYFSGESVKIRQISLE